MLSFPFLEIPSTKKTNQYFLPQQIMILCGNNYVYIDPSRHYQISNGGQMKNLSCTQQRLIKEISFLHKRIKELEQSELERRQTEDKYRTLIETTETGFVIIDSDGLVLDANPEYVRLTGHKDLREIVGRSAIEWTADSAKGKNAAAIKAVLEKGRIRNLEIDYVDSRGNITPVEINASSIQTEGKIQILTICRDITERRRTEETLQESRQIESFPF